MKQLVAPGVVQITSAPGLRSFVNPLTPRPPCFLTLWRDCTNMDAYLQFANGVIYHYDAPSDDDVRALVNAFVIGRTFNRSFRRSLSLGGGYEVFVGIIPSTAVVIYSYPPYFGTDPGDCPMGLDWGSLVWDSPPDTVLIDGTGSATYSFVRNVASSSGVCPLADDSDAQIVNSGTLSYTGPDVASVATVELTANHVGDVLGPTWVTVAVIITDAASNVLLDVEYTRSQPLTTVDYPFTVPATVVNPITVLTGQTCASNGDGPAAIAFRLTLTPST